MKSEVSVSTYQARAGACIQDSWPKPTKPHAMKGKTKVQMRGENKLRKKGRKMR